MLKANVAELSPDQRIIIAYDGMSLDEAATMHTEFNEAGFHPVAKANSLATRPGLDAVMRTFSKLDSQVMFDPKHHDTDNTMFNYITEDVSAEPQPPLMVTLHASNGSTALTEAVRGRNESVPNSNTLNLLGITVLTSLKEEVSSIYGDGETAESKFVDFAHRAQEAGLQGLVSSGEELIKGYEYKQLDGLLRVIPGIKLPDTADTAGQKRLYTPDVAIGEGADFVVIGRAITNAESPVAALEIATDLVDKAA
ncbi:MAG: orotidine-5'-phosphate decarboxylase [Candidatus Saccharibacteria bacterium]|nr:orotidine-5'-phosphate decarboxylase [Candidatus Saccharibacteria bacterium]